MILWDLVPEKWRAQAFIAGGYAACPAMAADLDLWIFVDGGTETSLSAAREEVLEHLSGGRWAIEIQGDEQTRTQYEGVNVTILKVCIIPYDPQDIHIMVVDAPVNAVLEGFDISTHQIALLPSGEVRRGSQWTPVTEPPVVLIDTARTPERLTKIQERYGKR